MTNADYSGGAEPNKPCIFPFKYNGQVHNECTDINTRKNICATEINGRGVITKFGYCKCDCPSKSTEVCIPQCQTKDDVPCQFPFKYKHPMNGDRIYYNCTKDFAEGKGAWCSTKTDVNGYHIPGEFGFCKEECLDDKSIKPTTTATTITTTTTTTENESKRFESGTYLYDEDDECGKSLGIVTFKAP